MFLPIWKKLKYMLLILVLSKEASVLKAAQISSESDKDWINQAIRFWTFTDPSIQIIALGAILIGR